MHKYNWKFMCLSKDETNIAAKEEQKNSNYLECLFKLSKEDKKGILKNLLLATSAKRLF